MPTGETYSWEGRLPGDKDMGTRCSLPRQGTLCTEAAKIHEKTGVLRISRALAATQCIDIGGGLNVPSGSMRYHSHKAIIDAWPEPSLRTFAEDHGVKYDTAKQWRMRNSIPPEQWLKTIRIANARGVPGVTHELLDVLRQEEKERRAAASDDDRPSHGAMA